MHAQMVFHTSATHTPFDAGQPLSALLYRRLPTGGSPGTINLANAIPQEGGGFLQTLGPAFRQIFEASATGWQHWYMDSAGQSGNLLSKHYADKITAFNSGAYDALEPAPGTSSFTLAPN